MAAPPWLIRLGGYARSVPLSTRTLSLLFIAVHCLSVLCGSHESLLAALCISGDAILYRFQVYRFLTHAVVHVNAGHLLMNVASLVSLGSVVERRMGTVAFLVLCLHFLVAESLLLITFGWVVSSSASLLESLGLGSLARDVYAQCLAGCSGLLLALMVFYAARAVPVNGVDAGREVVGLFWVTSRAFPWVMLVFVQFIFQNVSFVGHLMGIAAGYGYVHLATTAALSTQTAAVAALERAVDRARIPASLSGFVRACNAEGFPPPQAAPTGAAAAAAARLWGGATVDDVGGGILGGVGGTARLGEWVAAWFGESDAAAAAAVRYTDEEGGFGGGGGARAPAAFTAAAAHQVSPRGGATTAPTLTAAAGPLPEDPVLRVNRDGGVGTLADAPAWKVEKLEGMGFSREAATRALIMAQGSIELAVARLTTSPS